MGTTGDGPELGAGAGRLAEGIHTQPLLTPGESYKVSFACAGSGAAEAAVQSKGATEVKKWNAAGRPSICASMTHRAGSRSM
ncbi:MULTISPECIES: hypothetical protein [unclassified Streptomyces]|uniref:hypothetical protein n=1 Tax=unclassified Streptomyces TaxID=2593676 RepID=UPI00117E00D4|nr:MULTISPECIES: hypothetical protein [unclassified Streptomyces]